MGEFSLIVTGTCAPLDALFGPEILRKSALIISRSLNNLSFTYGHSSGLASAFVIKDARIVAKKTNNLIELIILFTFFHNLVTLI